MSAHVLRAVPALLGSLLLASPALAQGPSPGSPAAVPSADDPLPPQVVVVVPPSPSPLYYPPPLYYAYPPLPPSEGAPPPERGFSAKLYAGPAYERVFDTSIAGAELGAFFGAVRGISGWYGGFDAFLGRMDYGLFTFAVRPGAMWEARLGRVKLGLGLNLTMVDVQRATTGDAIISVGAGGSVFASVDLIQGERSALFLAAKLRADVLQGADATGAPPVLWGPSLALGWRYR